MACRTACLFLPLALLVLLVPGSWLEIVPEEIHEVVGKTLVVQCQYPPEQGPYIPKSWCRQTSPGWCKRALTSSKPRTSTQDSRLMIWDAPDAGLFIILMLHLKEEDSGTYWCGNYNSSENKITILRIINLVVSPATTTTPVWTSTRFLSTAGLVTSPNGTLGPNSTSDFEHRNSSSFFSHGSVTTTSLVTVLFALLAAKVLVLCSSIGGPAARNHL